MSHPLRLLVFDATQQRRRPAALGWSWRLGGQLYRGLGRIDAALGVSSFTEALDWLAQHEPSRPIAEVQFWGHGKWGRAFVDREALDRRALSIGHPLNSGLSALRERLAEDALIWFRTCETLGASAGQDFASALSDFTGATVAGHTFVIGFFQSGLHALKPGMRPHWSGKEGLATGTPEAPLSAQGSHPDHPNTITCLTGRLPPEVYG